MFFVKSAGDLLDAESEVLSGFPVLDTRENFRMRQVLRHVQEEEENVSVPERVSGLH